MATSEAIKTALMLRREMVATPAVMDALDAVEKAVLAASSARPVDEYPIGELSAELLNTLKWVAKDIGYRGEGDGQYIVIRTAEILKRHYPSLTLKDFRLAFEMCIAGELDDFLPKRDGQADRGHYQQFNAEYICKVLNAYKARRAWVIKKAREAAPKREPGRDMDMERRCRNADRRECINAYVYYKYKGRMPDLSPIGEMICYNVLAEAGLAEDMVVTPAEQRHLLQRTIGDLLRGGYAFDADRLRQEGVEAQDIKHGAMTMARRKALARTFDAMLEDDVQITDYIKFEQ